MKHIDLLLCVVTIIACCGWLRAEYTLRETRELLDESMDSTGRALAICGKAHESCATCDAALNGLVDRLGLKERATPSQKKAIDLQSQLHPYEPPWYTQDEVIYYDNNNFSH